MVLATGLTVSTLPALAQDEAPTDATREATTNLPAVVVTATRHAQQPFDLPVSIDAVNLEQIQADRASINPSESLREVPGVLARDRQNAAQD